MIDWFFSGSPVDWRFVARFGAALILVAPIAWGTVRLCRFLFSERRIR